MTTLTEQLALDREALEKQFLGAFFSAAQYETPAYLEKYSKIPATVFRDKACRKFWREFVKTGDYLKAADKSGLLADLAYWGNDSRAHEAPGLLALLLDKHFQYEMAINQELMVGALARGDLDKVRELQTRQGDITPLSIESEQEKTGPRIYSAKEIFDTDWPEPIWAVNEIQPVGLTITAGKPKLGKSWMALQKAYAIGTGERFLNFEVVPGRVLYIALEDHPRNIKKRQQKQLWDPQLDWNIDFVFKDQFWAEIGDIRNGGNEQIAWLIERNNYRLVIVDTFSRAVSGAQRSVEEMTEWLDPIQGTAHEKNAVVEFIDHHGKSANLATMDVVNDILESIGKGAVADTLWGLYRERGSPLAKLGMTGRDIPDKMLDLSFDSNTCLWKFEGGPDRPVLPQRQLEILSYLCENGTSNNRAVAAAVGLNEGNSHRELQELVAKGLASRNKDGREVFYTPTNRANNYDL